MWSFTGPIVLFVLAFFFAAGFLSKGPSSAGLLVPAGILAGVGVTLLLGTTFHLMEYVWPGFVLSPALGLLLLYLFSEKHSPGLLVPIGVLLTVGATSFIATVFRAWAIMWPGYILSPAIGLLLLFLFSERHNKGLLIPIGILGGISAFGFFGTFLSGNFSYGRYGFAGVLILVGLLAIFKKSDNDKHHSKNWYKRHSGERDYWNPEKVNVKDQFGQNGYHTDGSNGNQESWDEARNRQQRREYGQQAYREYDEKFNNPEYFTGKKDKNAQVDPNQYNPYNNSDYSAQNKTPK